MRGPLLTAVLLAGVVLIVLIVVLPRRQQMQAAPELRGLSFRDRRAVGRAVNRGEAVRDPRLAGAAVTMADWQARHTGGGRSRIVSVLCAILAVVFAAAVAVDLTDEPRRYQDAILHGAFLGLWLTWPLGLQRMRRSAKRAAARNRQLLSSTRSS